jgi:hypothetical protein
LAHGTPPKISRSQYDVPYPTLKYLCDDSAFQLHKHACLVFIALLGLTDVLDRHLEYVYNVDRSKSGTTTTSLELALNKWIDSLELEVRLIIIRGSHLDIPGAANLRLSYLALRLLLQRIELEADKQKHDAHHEKVISRYYQARQTAEEVLLLTREFQPSHLGDFWLSVSAFAYQTTVSFLLRCALETETSSADLVGNTAFKIACDLLDTLRKHQETFEWDLGDVCLAQHTEIVEKIHAGVAPDKPEGSSGSMELQDFVMPDASFIDQFFPNLWDPLQNAW